jgi:hypothetical protein
MLVRVACVRPGRALCFVVVAAALMGQGCGGGGNSDEEQITAVVNQLFAAQESGDAARACNDVYVIAEPGRPVEGEGEADGEADDEGDGEGGDACEATFEAANERREAEVKDLSTDISSINVDGETATAVVHTELQRADGSHLSQDVPYELLKTPDGWRIRIAEEG